LADFGLTSLSGTVVIQGRSASEQIIGGTPGYMAPELREEGIVPSRKSDIFSFSMIIIEIYTGDYPFANKRFRNKDQVFFAISNGSRPEKPKSEDFEDFGSQLWELTRRCWARSPIDRPEMDKVSRKLESFLQARR